MGNLVGKVPDAKRAGGTVMEMSSEVGTGLRRAAGSDRARQRRMGSDF
jgi:hypothetical protein